MSVYVNMLKRVVQRDSLFNIYFHSKRTGKKSQYYNDDINGIKHDNKNLSEIPENKDFLLFMFSQTIWKYPIF